MNVSTRFTIALHILTLLASSQGEALTSEYIAGSVNTNPVVVRRLLGLLRKQGFVSSQHLAFNVSRATFTLAPGRLRECGIEFIQRDRGFMDSIYLHDPNGLKVELACYKFETPEGFRAADVLVKAYALRLERGDPHITEVDVADAIELLIAMRQSMPLPDAVTHARS
jgi:hypothetical protein